MPRNKPNITYLLTCADVIILNNSHYKSQKDNDTLTQFKKIKFTEHF